MSTSAVKLLRVLFDATPGELGESNAFYAKRLNCSERSVSRALADLVRGGYVEVEHYRASGPGEVARTIRVNDVVSDLFLSRNPASVEVSQ